MSEKRNEKRQLKIRKRYLQFEDQNHFVVVFEGIVKIDQFRMMELIHYINFLPNKFLLHRMGHGNKLGREYISSGSLSTTVDNSERASSDLFENIVSVVDGDVFDLDRLRHVFTVNVEHELIVISRLLVASSTNLFARLVHFVLLLLKLSLDGTLGRDQRRHLARVRSSVNIFGANPEVVLVARAKPGNRHGTEPCVTDSDPAGHRVFPLLDQVIGDVATSVPNGRFPGESQRVVADVVHLRESRWIGSIADLYLDDGAILAKVVLRCDAVRSGIDAISVYDGEHRVPFLHLHRVVSTGLDQLSLSDPSYLRFRVTGERDLYHHIDAFVEEGGVSESWGHVQLGRCLDQKLALGRLDATFVHGAAEVLVRVLPEHVVNDQVVHVALRVYVVPGSAHDLSSALEPRDGRFRSADDLALELSVVVLHAAHLVQRLDHFRRFGRLRIGYLDRGRGFRLGPESGGVLGEHAELVLPSLDQIRDVDLRGQADDHVDAHPRLAAYFALVDPVSLDLRAAVRFRLLPRKIHEISADLGHLRRAGRTRRVEGRFRFDGIGSLEGRPHAVVVHRHHAEQVLLSLGQTLYHEAAILAEGGDDDPVGVAHVATLHHVVSDANATVELGRTPGHGAGVLVDVGHLERLARRPWQSRDAHVERTAHATAVVRYGNVVHACVVLLNIFDEDDQVLVEHCVLDVARLHHFSPVFLQRNVHRLIAAVINLDLRVVVLGQIQDVGHTLDTRRRADLQPTRGRGQTKRIRNLTAVISSVRIGNVGYHEPVNSIERLRTETAADRDLSAVLQPPKIRKI